MGPSSASPTDGELFQNMNIRVPSEPIDEDSHQQMNMRPPSEPRYNLRKRTHPQLQQHAILFLSKKFEKLTIHEVSDEDLSKPLKESVDPMGITFPPLAFIN